jgi:hypothetical protein
MTKLPLSHIQKTVEPSIASSIKSPGPAFYDSCLGSSSLFVQNCDKMNVLDFTDVTASCGKCKRLL